MEDTFAAYLHDLIRAWRDIEGTPLTEIIAALRAELAAARDQRDEETGGE